MWIEGVNMLYFRFTYLFGRSRYMVGCVSAFVYWQKCGWGDGVYNWFCSVCCNVVWWGRQGRKWNPVPKDSLYLSISTRGPPVLMSPSDDESLSTVQYAFSAYVLRKGLEMNSGFRLQSSDWKMNCTSPSLLVARFKIFIIKFQTSPGIEPLTCWSRGII